MLAAGCWIPAPAISSQLACVLIVAAMLVGHSPLGKADTPTSGKGSIADMLEYANGFIAQGDVLRARVVYDLMLRAFAKSDDRSRIQATCDSMVENLPAADITVVNISFWNCPESQLEAWLGPLDKHRGREPIPRSRVTPAYPDEPEWNGATVEVEFDIDTEGNVRNARVLDSSDSRFGAETIRAIQKWKYLPARWNGQKVEKKGIRVKISYEVEE